MEPLPRPRPAACHPSQWRQPTIIHIGDTYADPGATTTGPQADLNLGIKTFLNSTLVSNIVLDTTITATDTIDYVATDRPGLTSISTRTVIIQAATDNQASSTSKRQRSATYSNGHRRHFSIVCIGIGR
jgi:hypothetical protein